MNRIPAKVRREAEEEAALEVVPVMGDTSVLLLLLLGGVPMVEFPVLEVGLLMLHTHNTHTHTYIHTHIQEKFQVKLQKIHTYRRSFRLNAEDTMPLPLPLHTTDRKKF